MKPSSSPTAAASRLPYVDILRGFALIGVCAANLLIFSGFAYMTDLERAPLLATPLDRVLFRLELIFVENKFLGLFAILFGVSFWLFLESARARGADGGRGLALFYRRLAWLFVIGSVHGWLFWCFDVLRFYALWGLLLPLFLRTSQKTLRNAALFCAVLAPALVTGFRSQWAQVPADPSLNQLALRTFSSGTFLEFLRVNWRYDWHLTLSVSQIGYQVAIFGRLLLGLWAARAGIVSGIDKHRPLFRILLVVGSIAGVSANVADAAHLLDPGTGAGFLRPFAGRLIAEIGYLSLSVAYASALALLIQRGRAVARLQPLAAVGRTALSCYLLQTAIGLFLFYGFTGGPRWMGRIGPAWLTVVWIVGYAMQMALASAWLRRYRFGPAEWLWRSLTYRRIQPFRSAAPADP